ncbi:Uncharacterized protein APZ42_003678, partial [Daphnia magna]
VLGYCLFSLLIVYCQMSIAECCQNKKSLCNLFSFTPLFIKKSGK